MVTPPRFLCRAGVAVAVAATALVPTALSHSATAAGPAPAPHLVTAAATGALGADSAIACPVPSGSDFTDSWGASRSGGRRHEGVDMIADRGTPVVAAQSGDINFKQNRLGGNAAWLNSSNGNTFYYAHLDSFEGESRFVLQGEVVGYVGSTGNAKGSHLHFETHFDGTVGSPYDATYAACVQPIVDALHAQAAADAERLALHGAVTITRVPAAADDNVGQNNNITAR
jgi:murein DD-endopeptidase MepM/ murein hydrolase activator NlpD